MPEDQSILSRLSISSDEQLLVNYRIQQDSDSLVVLIQRYQHLVYGFCLKHLRDKEFAKDASMIVLEKVMIHAKNTEVRHFKSWMMTILRREVREVQLRMQKANQLIKPFDESYHSLEEEVYWQMDGKRLQDYQLDVLNEAFKTLREEQQICLQLFYFEKKSYSEIVELTGFSANEVKSLLQNARRNLQKKLEKATQAYDE